MSRNTLFMFLISALCANSLLADLANFKIDATAGVIHLIGNTYESQEDDLDNQLFKEAENGNIILASEMGIFGGKYGSNLFGIEDGSALALSRLTLFYKDLVIYKLLSESPTTKGASKSSTLLKKLKAYSSSFRADPQDKLRSLSELFSTLKDHDEVFYEIVVERRNRELISTIKGALQNHGNQALIELTRDHTIEKPFFLKIHSDITNWISLFEDMIRVYNEEDADNLKSFVEQFSQIFEKFEGPDADAWESFDKNWDDFFELIESARIDYKNQMYLKNIEYVFEKNKSKKIPFYVRVGLFRHVPFLYEKLKLKGYRVEINHIPVEKNPEEQEYVFRQDLKVRENFQKFLKELKSEL